MDLLRLKNCRRLVEGDPKRDLFFSLDNVIKFSFSIVPEVFLLHKDSMCLCLCHTFPCLSRNEIFASSKKFFFWCCTGSSLGLGYQRKPGGGTTGRAMVFCLGRPGLNPRSGFGFFSFQNCCQSILSGCRAFSNNV